MIFLEKLRLVVVLSLLAPLGACAGEDQDNRRSARPSGQPAEAAKIQLAGAPVVAKFQPYDIVLESQTDYGVGPAPDPFDFSRTRVFVNLRDPSGALVTWGNGAAKKFFAFWDGGKIWKVRVNLWQEGEWTYEVPAESADRDLQGKNGRISVGPALSRNDLSRHGMIIRFDKQKNHLTYSDGTPFFYMADTWWVFPEGFSDSTLGSLLRKRSPEYVGSDGRTLRGQGFTVVQTHGMNRSINGVTGPMATVRSTTNGLAYWQDMDRKIGAIKEHGLVAFLGYGSYAQMQSLEPADKARLYNMFMYALARYGGMGVSFLITQEYNKMSTRTNADGSCPSPYTVFQESGVRVCWYDPATYQSRWNLINLIGSDLRRFDPYGRALTVHSGVSEREPTPAEMTNSTIMAHMYPQDAKLAPWVDFLMLQEGHRKREVTAESYVENQRTKAFVESEVNWEGFLYYRKSATDPARDFAKKWSPDEALNLNLLHDDYLCGQVPDSPPTAADADAARACMAEIVVDSALASFMAGGLGISYGAQGLYASVTDSQNAGASGDWGPVQTMTEGAQQPGAGRFKFIKRAAEGLLTKGALLSPLGGRGVLTSDPSRAAPNVAVAGFTGAGTEEYLVHFKKQATVHQAASLRVNGANGQIYRITQVNLRNGAETTSTATASEGRIALPLAGVGSQSTHKNYLMVVRKQ